jgi:tetratricopeptide (TPR) repeat protein
MAALEDYNAGLKLYLAKNYTQAIPYFDAALNLEPDNTAALLARADCYYSLEKYQQALSDYEKVQAIQPQNTHVAQSIETLRAKIGKPSTVPSAKKSPGGDNRMEKRFGFYFGWNSDPMTSNYGISVAFNATSYLRLTGSFGYLHDTAVATTTTDGVVTNSTTYTVDSGTAFGFGMKGLMPHWEFSPVVGLNFSETFVNLPPEIVYFNILNGPAGGNYNLFLIYTNIGFDYQAKDGLDLGFGVDIPLNNTNGTVFPGLNVGKFF